MSVDPLIVMWIRLSWGMPCWKTSMPVSIKPLLRFSALAVQPLLSGGILFYVWKLNRRLWKRSKKRTYASCAYRPPHKTSDLFTMILHAYVIRSLWQAKCRMRQYLNLLRLVKQNVRQERSLTTNWFELLTFLLTAVAKMIHFYSQQLYS